MKRDLLTAILMTVVLTVLLGLIYPLLVTGLAQAIFPREAQGSLITRDGQIRGSELIGQPFTSPAYFHARPSAAGPAGYAVQTRAGEIIASGGSNLGPTSRALVERVNADAARLRGEQGGGASAPVPVELVTTSASGLDPHLSPAGAAYQTERVARARGAAPAEVRRLVEEFTEGRTFGLLGEPRVNVLRLNLELDRRFPRAAP